MSNPIATKQFYGQSLNEIYKKLEEKIELNKKQYPLYLDKKPGSIFDPPPYKEEFWKQNEALTNAAEHSKSDDILCCFVFQDENERRRFIVTYPEEFWKNCESIPLEKRVFYEVIPENSPCFLYYDLEFDKNLNEGKNGIHMTQTIIDITCDYIAKYWNYSWNKSIVINLDSSRQDKFSKHLIFSTKDTAFENNYHVGYFVKMICSDIVSFISSENAEHEILRKYNKSNLEELVVETNKGKKLFIDINVYTKNRHFRIYKATKWNKNSHLLLASDCQYVWNKKLKNAKQKAEKKRKDMEIFINSLISYLPNKKKLKLLSFNKCKEAQIQDYSQFLKNHSTKSFFSKEYPKSPYFALDRYVSNYIKPGKIRDSRYIEKNNSIFFEITGNRYCNNIGRWHKSNNIYFVVDINNKVMYQKCHDEDCAGFISAPVKLPIEVTFYFEDETDSILSTFDT